MLGRPMRPYPTPDGKAVLFLRSGPRSAKLGLFEFDVATKKTRELLTPEQVLGGAEEKLSAEEKAARADYLVVNEGTVEDLEAALAEVVEQIKGGAPPA